MVRDVISSDSLSPESYFPCPPFLYICVDVSPDSFLRSIIRLHLLSLCNLLAVLLLDIPVVSNFFVYFLNFPLERVLWAPSNLYSLRLGG